MKLYQRIGLIFAGFSAFSLMFNIFTPGNPDHLLNVIEQSSLSVIFILTYFAPQPFAGTLQILSLCVVAFIPMGISDSPFFGAVIATICLVLIYAYDGYRTRVIWKLPVTFVVLFALCAIASSHFTPPSFETYARAFGWTLFISIFCLLLALVNRDIETRFHSDFAKALVKQNRELADLNHDLAERCLDATDRK